MNPAIEIATIALSTALIAGCQSPETKSEPAPGTLQAMFNCDPRPGTAPIARAVSTSSGSS